MKKLILILAVFMFIGCSSDDVCFEFWKVSEWCETPSNCNVVGCQTPDLTELRFKCSDLNGISEGDIVKVRQDGCATFYRMYIAKAE